MAADLRVDAAGSPFSWCVTVVVLAWKLHGNSEHTILHVEDLRLLSAVIRPLDCTLMGHASG